MVNNIGCECDYKYEKLSLEIERLTRELDQAINEKVQSAKCGLALLEEKCTLQQRCEELETLYEETKQELNVTKRAFRKLQTSQKITTKNGIQQEDDLLNQSAVLETSLTLQIFDLEHEIKQLRQKLECIEDERNALLEENRKISKEKSDIETDKSKLKNEIKELKQAKTNLLANFVELENENSLLQKKVLHAKYSEQELTAAVDEIASQMVDNTRLAEQLEEMVSGKHHIETQLNETLEALQIEREARNDLQRELDFYIKESFYKNKSLAESIIEVKEIEENELNLSTKPSEIDSLEPDDKNCSYLQSEIFEELEIFEEEVKNFEKELDGQLQDHGKINLQDLRAKTAVLSNNISALRRIEICLVPESISSSKKLQLPQELQRILNTALLSFISVLQSEFMNLKNTFISLSVEDHDCSGLSEILGNMTAAKEILTFLNRDLSDQDVISKTFEDEVQSTDPQSSHLSRGKATNAKCELEILSAEITASVKLLQECIKDQKISMRQSETDNKNGTCSRSCDEVIGQLWNQIKGKESLLLRKQKEISELQAVIKSNRQVATEAVLNIKEKFDREKKAVADHLSDLYIEIECLKDEIAGYKGLREKFTSRCREYVESLFQLTTDEAEISSAERKIFADITKTAMREKLNLQSSLDAIQRKKNTTEKKRVHFDIPIKSCIKKKKFSLY